MFAYSGLTTFRQHDDNEVREGTLALILVDVAHDRSRVQMMRKTWEEEEKRVDNHNSLKHSILYHSNLPLNTRTHVYIYTVENPPN